MFVLSIQCSSKKVHDGWFETSIISSSSSDRKYRMDQIIDHRGSWINKTLKSLLFSQIVSVRSLFLWTFYKSIFIDFKIAKNKKIKYNKKRTNIHNSGINLISRFCCLGFVFYSLVYYYYYFLFPFLRFFINQFVLESPK